MSALMVTIAGATASTTAATSIRRSIASRGAATLMASCDERVGGSFTQSVIRFPRNTPAVLASKATTATATRTVTQPDFDRFGDPPDTAPGADSAATPGSGGANAGGDSG